ncbi:hypothetical protein [Thioclava sp. JM3]|uniref:hypothetical protein n=1 Tax=Thioclava sp. JM3 TaxID=1973004 RepID=UPI001180185D|nr:hypothetical protein [Thioclava sp. JM3]
MDFGFHRVERTSIPGRDPADSRLERSCHIRRSDLREAGHKVWRQRPSQIGWKRLEMSAKRREGNIAFFGKRVSCEEGPKRDRAIAIGELSKRRGGGGRIGVEHRSHE